MTKGGKYMFCKNCGKPNEDGSKFCSSCGYNLEEEVTGEVTISEETNENTVSEETEKVVPESNTDLDKIKEKATEIGSELKEKVANIDVDEAKDQAKNFAENEVKNYKNFKNLTLKQKLIRIVIPVIVLIIIISIIVPKGPSDEDYISSARTAVSEKLKSPATAMYSNEKIVDEDDYGRVLVTLTVDSQNSFGAYVRENYAIVIKSYDTSTDKFVFYPTATQHWSSEFDFLEDELIEAAKKSANWNEPLEND